MQFGFSYVGLVFLIMLMVPNMLWTKHKPKDYEKYVGNENRVLLAFERGCRWFAERRTRPLTRRNATTGGRGSA